MSSQQNKQQQQQQQSQQTQGQQPNQDSSEKELYRFLNPEKPKQPPPSGPDPQLVLLEKVCNNWVRHQLKEPLNQGSLADLKDGSRLRKFAETISGKAVDSVTPSFKYGALLEKYPQYKDIILSLNLLSSDGVAGTLYILPQDLAEGKINATTSLVFSVILRYQLPVGTDTLLKWCIENSLPHTQVIITNFRDSWTDGVALCALVGKLSPESIPIESISKENAVDNITLALNVAEKKLGVPKLFDVKDLENEAIIEKPMTAYLSFIFNKFGPPSFERTLRERLEKLEAGLRERDDLLQKKATEITIRIKEKEEVLEDASKKMKTLEETLITRQNKFEETRAELEKILTTTIREKTQLNEAFEEAISTKNSSINALQSQMSELRERCHEKDTMLLRSAQDLKFLIASHEEVSTQLSEARNKNSDILRKMTELNLRMPFYVGKPSEGEVPKGKTTIVMTDVEGADDMWEKAPEAMAQSLRNHNDLVITLAKKFSGFIVKMESGAFTIAFREPQNAIQFTNTLQQQLLDVVWPEALLELEEAKVVKGPNVEKLFSGLRVKCAIHHGEPLHHEDPASGKVFYVGPVMNMLSGILDIAAGGQVVITSDAWSVVQEGLDQSTLDVKEVEKIPATDGEIVVSQVLPPPLQLREFKKGENKPKTAVGDAHKALENQLSNLKGENDQLKGALNAMEEKAKEAERKAQELQKALEEALKGVARGPQVELEAAVREIGHLINTQEKLKGELVTTTKKNEQVIKYIDKLNEELKLASLDQRVVMKQYIELKEIHDDARGKITGLKTENDELHRRIEELMKDDEPKKKQGIIRRLIGGDKK